MEDLWKFFDGHIYCINLREREDRMKESKEIFDKYKIPVKYFKVDRHPKGGEHGCFESHVKVITKAYNEGAERVLIFEDDVIDPIRGIKSSEVKKGIDFMKKEKDWDIFYFGCEPYVLFSSSSKTKYPGVYKLKAIYLHAYVVNRSAMKKIINLKFKGVPIDTVYNDEKYRSYALYPMIFFQRNSESDIRNLSLYTRYFANRRRIEHFENACEWYAYNINIPLIFLFMILFLLLLIFLYYYFL